MKKVYAWLILIILAGVLIACGTTTATDESEIISLLATQQSEQATQLANQDELIRYLLTVVPRNTPRAPDVTIEPTPYQPVVGSVTIEDGGCCAGGTVGETIELLVQFEAMSPIAEITQMRYVTGLKIADDEVILREQWQDFQTEVVIEYTINTGNWIGYWVTAQFMDADGNVSPFVSDDISIEGMPEMPTESP